MINQLDANRNDIASLYGRVNEFYSAQWDPSVPFKIMLYPIPHKSGLTTAIPKGNALWFAYNSY